MSAERVRRSPGDSSRKQVGTWRGLTTAVRPSMAFSATVYESNNQISFNAMGVSDFGTRANGVKHYMTSGTYYLQITSSCSWHVVARPG